MGGGEELWIAKKGRGGKKRSEAAGRARVDSVVFV